jgi:hypothetical protein
MLSGANAFEISDIERMNIGEHQPGAQDVTMLHALWLPEITIRQPQDYFLFADDSQIIMTRDEPVFQCSKRPALA